MSLLLRGDDVALDSLQASAAEALRISDATIQSALTSVASLDVRVHGRRFGRSPIMPAPQSMNVNLSQGERFRLNESVIVPGVTPLRAATLQEILRLSPNTITGAAFGGGGGTPAQGNLFNSGWENAPGTGCNFANNTDNGTWDDYGPSSTCSVSPPYAEVITSDKNSGNKCLKMHFPDFNGSAINGPDFRIIIDLGVDHAETYYRWYEKWDSNWRWAPGGDHKMLITGPRPQQQLVYYNLRGHVGGTTAYPTIHFITPDSVYSDQTVAVTAGVWHYFELSVRWGAGGWVRAKVDGQLLTLSHEVGTVVNPENFNPGSGGGFINMDNTYNNYAYFEANVPGSASNAYYDDVACGNVTWIGA